MAMEGTHIRFALDLAPELKITNFDQYLSGTIYPDSRYVTKTERKLTHGETAPRDPFEPGLDDFHKGWATHLVYDDHDIQKYKDLSPRPDQKIQGFDDLWIFITAAKLIDDMQSYDAIMDKITLIQTIQTAPPINNEDPALLDLYYKINKKVYSKKPDLKDYRTLIQDWNIPDNIIDQLISKTKEFQSDPVMMKKIHSIYHKVTQEIKEGV